MKFQTRRLAVFVATMALVLVLALAGCAGRGGASNGAGSGNTGSSQTTATNDVAALDSDVAAYAAGLDQLSTDASLDL
ncbi:MAG TPA: hypothetical protein VF807_10230, partial [Ktedonobacterales bacterium]